MKPAASPVKKFSAKIYRNHLGLDFKLNFKHHMVTLKAQNYNLIILEKNNFVLEKQYELFEN